MPLPAGYGAPLSTPDLLPLSARGAGTYTSDPVASFGTTNVEMWVHVSATSGLPQLDCAVQNSPDGTTWSTVPGSATTMTGVGSAVANVSVSPTDYIRVASTVSGSSTPTVTYRVLAMLIVPNDD